MLDYKIIQLVRDAENSEFAREQLKMYVIQMKIFKN